MSYTIKKSDGTTLAIVPENEVVTNAASVSLIGRGAVNYGIAHSQNFVQLLENFANTTAPAYPLEGQLWFDQTVGSLKVYKSSAWVIVGSGASVSGTANSNGIGGPVYVPIGTTTSAIAFIAGGKVVAALASVNSLFTDLPATITVLGTSIPFAARFPAGLVAGMNLAVDSADYLYTGHVPISDQSLYAGGGVPLAATTFCDLGTTSVALSISNNVIIAAYSQTIIAQSALPVNITVAGIVVPFRASFPTGLVAGLTFADTFGIGLGSGSITGSGGVGNGVTLEVVDAHIADEATARASAITSLYSYANSTFATSSITNTINSSFLSATGQSTLAAAIDYVITSATEGTANASAGVTLRSEIQNAITGASSFANALSRIDTAITTTNANSSSITELQNTFTTGLGVSMSSAAAALSTLNNTAGAAATFNTNLQSSLLTNTGQSTVASAISTLWTRANAAGSAAGWGLELNAGGQVVGLELVADSAQKKSSFEVKADNFKIYSDATPSIIPFEVRNNIVYIKTAVIGDLTIGTQKLADNSVTVSGSVAQGAVVYGFGGGNGYGQGSYVIICSYTLVLSAAATVFAIANGRHSYSNSPRAWGAGIFVNGAQMSLASGSGAITDSITTSASFPLDAGTYSITFQHYAADSTVSLSSSNLFVQGVYK